MMLRRNDDRRIHARRAGIGLLLGLAVALTACAPADPGAAESSGVVRAAMYSSPQSRCFIGKGYDRNTDIVRRLITDSLVQYNANLELVPMLATSWELSEDGMTVTFRIRPDVRWHDGTRLTSADVVFSVRKSRDAATQEPSFLTQFQDLVSLETLGEHEVRAVYRKPYADFLEAWTLPIIPEHLAGRDDDLLTGTFAAHPVGCGPFRFVRHVPDVEVVLEANPDYWMGRPELDGIRFAIVPDDNTAYQALLQGDLDVMGTPPDIWRKAMASDRAARLGRMVYTRLMVWYIGWNQDGSNPFFTDPRVRRAMLLALDREPFIEKVLAGMGRPAATTYPPGMFWAAPEIEPLAYDPDLARQLLDEAGWVDRDGDGVRERDGRSFAFTLLEGRSTQAITARIVEWVQQSLAEIGVRMQIETLEWGAFVERRKAGGFDAVSSFMSFSPIADQFEIYHSSARENGHNFVGFVDTDVDRLLEQGRVTFETGRRLEIYHALQRRLVELQPMACLFHFTQPVLYDRRLAGLAPCPIDFWRVTPGPRTWSWSEDRN